MNEKFLVKLYVPLIDEVFNVYLPVNSLVSNDILLLNKAIFELTNGEYMPIDNARLYDRDTGEMYATNVLIRETNIRNGSGVTLI